MTIIQNNWYIGYYAANMTCSVFHSFIQILIIIVIFKNYDLDNQHV